MDLVNHRDLVLPSSNQPSKQQVASWFASDWMNTALKGITPTTSSSSSPSSTSQVVVESSDQMQGPRTRAESVASNKLTSSSNRIHRSPSFALQTSVRPTLVSLLLSCTHESSKAITSISVIMSFFVVRGGCHHILSKPSTSGIVVVQACSEAHQGG